ncbi:hypothetical protein Amet_1048 [Alkaliphilus metalliredigens QYMF]|uniref:Bacteriocin n=1 Tax=Alkaliphilus metalliredigens (strain QYMF) TaxID=293826 RepID=A6TM45_ALKMQ|nr:hypothetical protein [Alkaliphilus metalliredigens]ABR47263.1 hypothetical protein Amet_1048 [Alkaliphilus metalliredigens QYMF]
MFKEMTQEDLSVINGGGKLEVTTTMGVFAAVLSGGNGYVVAGTVYAADKYYDHVTSPDYADSWKKSSNADLINAHPNN